MTNLEYQKAVRRTLGLAELDTAALPVAVVLSAINDALKSISAEWEWHWLFATETASTTADDNTVAIPDGYLRTIYFSIDGRAPLGERSLADLVDPDEASAEPLSFALAGANFHLWPTPATAESYTHVYFRSEPALAVDGDVPLLPDVYSPWLVAEAALRLAFRTNSPAKYAILKEEAGDWRSKAVREAKRNRNTQSHRIKRVRESIWTGF